MENTNFKTCPYTKKTFIPKRANQIYCSREAQIKHNNLVASSESYFFNKIIRILKRNYKIIDEQNKLGKNSISIDYLKGKGFNFNYFTSLEIRDGIKCFGLFNFIYIVDNENKSIQFEKNNNYLKFT